MPQQSTTQNHAEGARDVILPDEVIEKLVRRIVEELTPSGNRIACDSDNSSCGAPDNPGVALMPTKAAKFQLTAECETNPTGWDGVRHHCYSGWDKFTAIEGSVINRDSVTITSDEAGSDNRYDLEYDDWVELYPNSGLVAPRTIRLRSYARGPKGSFSGRGWSKYKLSGTYVSVK